MNSVFLVGAYKNELSRDGYKTKTIAIFSSYENAKRYVSEQLGIVIKNDNHNAYTSSDQNMTLVIQKMPLDKFDINFRWKFDSTLF